MSEEKEIWKDIKGYEGLYQVSNLGRVKSLEQPAKPGSGNHARPEVILKLRNRLGYSVIGLYKNTKQKYHSVNRLVAQAFIPNPENKSETNHINGIKNDNRVENLEWCTRSENINHSYNVLGNVGAGRKLTKDQVFEILACEEGIVKTGLMFNVSQSVISCIRRGKTYKKWYNEFKNNNP